jgi:hypothetical protein
VATSVETVAMSSLTTPSTSSKKAAAMKDSSLLAVNGPWGRRLDKYVDHFCVEVKGRPKCAFHRWASGLEHTTNVFACSFCGVALCVECFKIFHTEKSDDLIANKKTLSDHFVAQREAKKLAKAK